MCYYKIESRFWRDFTNSYSEYGNQCFNYSRYISDNFFIWFHSLPFSEVLLWLFYKVLSSCFILDSLLSCHMACYILDSWFCFICCVFNYDLLNVLIFLLTLYIFLSLFNIYIYIYILFGNLPLYNGGNHYRGNSGCVH